MISLKDLIIVGAGGFGRELLQWVKDINYRIENTDEKWNILGFIDDDPNALEGYACDYGVIGRIRDWIPKEGQRYAMAIANPSIKEQVANMLKTRGAVFARIVHPTASISDYADVGEGLVMYPNSLISVNTKIGDFVTLLSSSVGHDAEIGDYCTISSYCDITGGVKLEERVFLGSHAAIVPRRRIKKDAYVAAGSVVVSNVKDNARVMGNPAVRMDF